jgi:hypothetical protein
MADKRYRDICVGCGCNLTHATELGESGIYNPDGPGFDLCMPCWNDEERLVDESGTNFQPDKLSQYYATFGETRPGIYSVIDGKYV